MKPMAIDLFCGLGGWAEGFLAEGYDVVGFDIEVRPYPGQLVIQDVLTLHGSQFKDAAVIVASPPCQKYSQYAMPFRAMWHEHDRMDDDGAPPGNYMHKPCPDKFMFWRAMILRREAEEVSGRKIPLLIENVRGAQKFLWRSDWNYGSFHLWGDVPALMPDTSSKRKATDGQKVPAYSDPRRNGGKGVHLTSPQENAEGTKIGGDWFSDPNSTCRKHGSRSSARKQASAQIAKIPFELAAHIARVYYPKESNR